MTNFRDFLKEQFAENKDFEKGFFAEMEKARIALEIASFREKAHLTQKQLADRVGTSQSAIARLENDNYQNYSIRILRKIAEVLDLELVVSLREKNKKDAVKKVPATKVFSLVGYGGKREIAHGYKFEGVNNLSHKKIVGG